MSYPLFFHKLGDRDIWSPDEDEYVQVNREMVLDGHWMYPTETVSHTALNRPASTGWAVSFSVPVGVWIAFFLFHLKNEAQRIPPADISRNGIACGVRDRPEPGVVGRFFVLATLDFHCDDGPDSIIVSGIRCRAGRFKEEPDQIG
jgi:hypothetical protein